ncbi:MAG: hypothetical protein CM1200mP40_36280 [Gammaproteobacteria bacterium]|nr:MAG: hypothetical protein CM1200mP40_36280 [Gammaproteobacteria bacterium]
MQKTNNWEKNNGESNYNVWWGNTVLTLVSINFAQEWEVPRTHYGKPDLQGVWTNKTLTPLTRNQEFGDQRP